MNNNYFISENVSRGCSLQYSEEFCSTSVEHRVLASVSGSLVSVKMVEELSNCLVGVASNRGGEEQMVIWNLESGQCVRTLKLDPDFHPPVGLLKCVFRDDKLVIICRVGWKIALTPRWITRQALAELKRMSMMMTFSPTSLTFQSLAKSTTASLAFTLNTSSKISSPSR